MLTLLFVIFIINYFIYPNKCLQCLIFCSWYFGKNGSIASKYHHFWKIPLKYHIYRKYNRKHCSVPRNTILFTSIVNQSFFFVLGKWSVSFTLIFFLARTNNIGLKRFFICPIERKKTWFPAKVNWIVCIFLDQNNSFSGILRNDDPWVVFSWNDDLFMLQN